MSKFSDSEIRFLLDSHHVERAVGNAINVRHFLSPMVDPREIGMPEHMFDRILEDRARRLGAKFTEFRNQRKQTAPAAAPSQSLTEQIESTKLF